MPPLDSLAHRILAIPDTVKWLLAILGAAIGLAMILTPDRLLRRLRMWLVLEPRLVRRPGYRRMLKTYGWLLFGTGVMLMILLVLTRRA